MFQHPILIADFKTSFSPYLLSQIWVRNQGQKMTKAIETLSHGRWEGGAYLTFFCKLIASVGGWEMFKEHAQCANTNTKVEINFPTV